MEQDKQYLRDENYNIVAEIYQVVDPVTKRQEPQVHYPGKHDEMPADMGVLFSHIVNPVFTEKSCLVESARNLVNRSGKMLH